MIGKIWSVQDYIGEIKPSSKKQRDAVAFCERELQIVFSGNIADSIECSDFLDEYLDLARDCNRM